MHSYTVIITLSLGSSTYVVYKDIGCILASAKVNLYYKLH